MIQTRIVGIFKPLSLKSDIKFRSPIYEFAQSLGFLINLASVNLALSKLHVIFEAFCVQEIISMFFSGYSQNSGRVERREMQSLVEAFLCVPSCLFAFQRHRHRVGRPYHDPILLGVGFRRSLKRRKQLWQQYELAATTRQHHRIDKGNL